MHPLATLTLLTAALASLSPAHLLFLPSSTNRVSSHVVASTTRQCDEFISVFNITNSSSASLIHAHVRLWLNTSAQAVNVEVSRLVSTMSDYSLDVDGWNQSYEVPAYRSDRTFNALYTLPMPSNGSATIELQLSYASMQNLSVVAVPFNNWTVALDFKYKCRMASGTYGENQLYSCLCCNSPGDHQDTDTCPVVTMYQEGDNTNTTAPPSSSSGESCGDYASCSSSSNSSSSGEATNSTTSGDGQGQGSGSGGATNSTTSGSSEGQGSGGGQGSGQANNSTTSGSGEATNSTSGEGQGQGSGSGQATNSTSGSSEGQGSGQATNSTTSGSSGGQGSGEGQGSGQASNSTSSGSGEGQGQGSGSGQATNSTTSGSSEGQGSGQTTNSTTSGSGEATSSTTSGEGQGSGSGQATNSTASGEGQDSGKGSGSGISATNTTTIPPPSDVPVPPEPKMSTLEWILVGILGALVVLLLLIGVLALVVRKSGINFFLS